MKVFIILAILLISTDISVSYKSVTDDWLGEKWMEDHYLLKYKFDHKEKVITIRAEATTKGWVGFGFSRHGKLTEVDMVIGWLDKFGRVTFKDFWINKKGDRSLDASQDWTLLHGESNATHTALEFKRRYRTSDDKHDVRIYEKDIEKTKIVYAYSFMEPGDINDIPYPYVEEISDFRPHKAKHSEL